MKRSRVVAVVSDFGADSFYVGVMKGAVSHAAPECRIVDLTHSIAAYAIAEGSYILDAAFDFLPSETVFLVVVDPGVGGRRRNLILESDDRYIVAPDNGLITDVAARNPSMNSYVIDQSKLERFRVNAPVGRTFLGRDVFAPAAGALAAGHSPAEVGTRSVEPLVTVGVPPVRVDTEYVTAAVRYVDPFGNLLTGITVEHLRAAFGKTAPADIRAAIDGRDIGALCRYYGERPAGSLMAVLNSWGRLEVAACERRAFDHFPGRRPEELAVELRRVAVE
jgi:S-adenosylmethionine hydrolase